MALEGTSLLLAHLELSNWSLSELLALLPLQSIRPGLVTEPVANEISITSINQDWDLLKDSWHKTVERLHPVTLEEEVAVDVKVARVVRRHLNTKGLHNLFLVEVLGNPSKSWVAEIVVVLALATDIIDVLAGALVWANHGVVAVDGGWDAGPDGLGLVALLDQGLAAWEGVVHGAALGLVEDSWVATVTAGHWAVVVVLGKWIGQAVTDEDGLEVDVALLVGKDLRGEDWNVVASVGLSGNVEILLGVLWELLEEEGQKGVDVLARCNGVGDAGSRVGVADINWLVEEDDGGVVVPRVWVVVDLELLVEGGWAELDEHTSEGRAAWATVEPEDDWVVLWVVARLEEPCKSQKLLPNQFW